MIIRRITPKDTYRLRHQILRPNQDIEQTHYPGDFDEKTFHLGVIMDQKIVSVASFYYEYNPQLGGTHQFRLRGMATEKEYQGRQCGSTLVQHAYPVLKANLCNVLWCNARTSAQKFYEKIGFLPTGEIFDIPDIGPHILMQIKMHT